MWQVGEMTPWLRKHAALAKDQSLTPRTTLVVTNTQVLPLTHKRKYNTNTHTHKHTYTNERYYKK